MPITPVLTGGPRLELPSQTLLDVLEERAGHERPWLTFHHGHRADVWSADRILRQAWKWSAGFGEARGERVGIWQPNGPEFAAAFFGALGAGAVPVPLPWPVMEGDFAAALEKLRPVLTRARLVAIAAPERARIDGAACAWAAPKSARGFEHRPAPEDAAFIQFTSGSTATPRGAVISHRAAVYNAHALVKGLGLGPDDIGVSWIPFFHDMGLVGVMLSSLVGGFSTHVLRPGEFLLHPWTWLDLIGTVGATLTVAPDFGYAFAARRCGTRLHHLQSLRCALTGSEPIHLATLEAFTQRFAPGGFKPEAFTGAYGLAENTLAVSVGPALGRLRREANRRALPTVGTPLPGMELALDGQQLLVRSPSLMMGYFEEPELTARALDDGWLRTGDLAAIEDGQVFITGREKELVIKAGRKFHPSEIEQLIAGAIDTPPNGVAAFNDADELVLVIEQRRVVAEPDSAAVRALIADRLGVRVDRVEWVGAGTLPRTTSGKLQRNACAARFGAHP